MWGNDGFVPCTLWCISSIQLWLDYNLPEYFNCVWPLLKRLTLLHLTLPICPSLPFCFPSVSITHSPNASTSRPELWRRRGIILRSQLSFQIYLWAQRDFLICVTNTNASKFPQPWLLTSLIPCNALFTSSLAYPLSAPIASRIRRGTATHDFTGRKSIRPWRLHFMQAINRSASWIYFFS